MSPQVVAGGKNTEGSEAASNTVGGMQAIGNSSSKTELIGVYQVKGSGVVREGSISPKRDSAI